VIDQAMLGNDSHVHAMAVVSIQKPQGKPGFKDMIDHPMKAGRFGDIMQPVPVGQGPGSVGGDASSQGDGASQGGSDVSGSEAGMTDASGGGEKEEDLTADWR